MQTKEITAALVLGMCSMIAAPASATPEKIILSGSEYTLVDSTISRCPDIANDIPGVVVIFQHNPGPGSSGRTLWSVYDSWQELQGTDPELAYAPDSNPEAFDQFLGCYRLSNHDVYAATSALPHNLVDCVANSRFEGMVKHVYSNDSERIDWVKVHPLSDGSEGIWVEEYLAIPIQGQLDTMFHGAYYIYPDDSITLDWGAIARGLLTYEVAQSIVDDWDASYCRKAPVI